MTQEQVVAAAGIDRAYLSQLENDHKSPTVDMLFRTCKALGVKASGILARVEGASRGMVSPVFRLGHGYTVRPPLPSRQ